MGGREICLSISLPELLADDRWLDPRIDQAGQGGVRLTGERDSLPEYVKAVLQRGPAAELLW